MSDDKGRISRLDPKEDLIDAIRATFGTEPHGLRAVINALAHPEVIDETLDYFKSLDTKHMCQIYSYPWNCAREAEAKFETIGHGWALAGDYDELWCKACRERATDDI